MPALDAASSNLVGAAAQTKRTEAEAQQLSRQLREQQAEVTEAIELAQAFTQLVRQRQPESLDLLAATRLCQYGGGHTTLRRRAVRGLCRGQWGHPALEHGSRGRAHHRLEMLKRQNVWLRAP